MGCCGLTLWNRLEVWRQAGVLEQLHRLLLGKLLGADRLDFSRIIVESASVRAMHGGIKQTPATAAKTARNITWPLMPVACRWPLSVDHCQL
jgi:hypothetical protein